MASPPTTPLNAFPFPREYSFPPFYTLQPNPNTRHAQLIKWSSLVLSFCRHHRLYRLSLSDATTSPTSPAYLLFNNQTINRRLSLACAKEVVEFMRKNNQAEWYEGDTTTTTGGGGTGGDEVWIYWRSLEQWAMVVEQWVEETGNKGQVMTVYELVEGESTRGSEFWGLDQKLLIKALQVLVRRGKAQIMGQEENLGVKFF